MSNEHVEPTVRSILDTICPPVERDMRPIEAAIAPLATMGQPVTESADEKTHRETVDAALRANPSWAFSTIAPPFDIPQIEKMWHAMTREIIRLRAKEALG
jgi:hypothetical protein